MNLGIFFIYGEWGEVAVPRPALVGDPAVREVVEAVVDIADHPAPAADAVRWMYRNERAQGMAGGSAHPEASSAACASPGTTAGTETLPFALLRVQSESSSIRRAPATHAPASSFFRPLLGEGGGGGWLWLE